MSIVTAILIQQAWVILLGIIGYLVALLVDLVGGKSLGRTGAVRLAMAEQENRELKAEQSRLLGAIRERDDQISNLVKKLGEKGEAAESPSLAGTELEIENDELEKNHIIEEADHGN